MIGFEKFSQACLDLKKSLEEFSKAIEKLDKNGKTIHTIRHPLPNRKLFQSTNRRHSHPPRLLYCFRKNGSL